MHHFLSVIITRLFLDRMKEEKGQLGKVTLPKGMFGLGIVTVALFAVLGIVFLFSDGGWVGSIIMFVMALLSSSLIIAYVNQRITYDDDKFTQHTFFGTVRTFSYADITGIRNRDGMGDTRLFVGEHKVFIDQIAVGRDEFLSHVKKRYAELNDGARIPDAAKPSKASGLFCGNVSNTGEWLLLFILVGCCVLGISALMCVTGWPQEVDVTALTECRPDVGEAYAEDGTLVLKDINGKVYQLHRYEKAVTEVKTLEQHIRNRSALLLRVAPTSTEGLYDIAYIATTDGTVYLTPEDIYRAEQESFTRTVVFCLVLCVAWAAFVIFVIYVGRNPKKFNPKLVNKLFKPGTIQV